MADGHGLVVAGVLGVFAAVLGPTSWSSRLIRRGGQGVETGNGRGGTGVVTTMEVTVCP